MASPLEVAGQRWSLTDSEPVADTRTSTVYKVRRRDGSPAGLKILKPYGADEIGGAHLMQWYAGEGSALIFDIAEPMILMEWLGGGPLSDVTRAGDDDRATGILCDVMSAMHRPRSKPPASLRPLRHQFEALFTTDPEFWPRSHRGLVARAIEMAKQLLKTSPPPIPLHGDFHHDNVAHGERGWLTIDPKGLLGDPAYEVANVFRNPYGASEVASKPERIDQLASRFGATLGVAPKRILSWAAAHSAISAVWDHAANQPFDWDVTMLPLLLDAADRA